MQAQNWTNPNKNPQITSNTQSSNQNKQNQIAFQYQSPTNFYNQKENYLHKENSIQDQKQKVYNLDDLQDLCTNQEILKYLGYSVQKKQNQSIRERYAKRKSKKNVNSQQQSSPAYVKIPYEKDFVIFTANCPQLGLSQQEVLMKKESLQSRKLNLWIQNYHSMTKNCRNPNQLKLINTQNIIPTNQNSTKMRTRGDHNQSHQC